MRKMLGRLSLGAWLVLAPGANAGPTDIEELLRLLRSGVGEQVAREWMSGAEIAAAPTADQLLELKAAGASDDMLVDLVRRSGEVTKRYAVKRVQRVDARTGRAVMELTNQAADGTFPPSLPQPSRSARPLTRNSAPPDPEPAWAPSMYEAPEPIYVEVPVPVQAPGPVYRNPPRTTSRLRIIPARGPRAYYESANPPGHHLRYRGFDGKHFPHYREDTYPYPPPFFFLFDVETPFFRTGALPTAPVKSGSAYQPHPSLYESRPVGFEHR